MSLRHAAVGTLVGAIVAKIIPIAPFLIVGTACGLLYMLVRLLIRFARAAVQSIRTSDWLKLPGRATERIGSLEQELAVAYRQNVELRTAHETTSDMLQIAHRHVADLKNE